MASFRNLSALLALLIAIFTLQTSALLFQVDSLDCNELDYLLSITPTEWQEASYLELFFVSTQGAQNYSTLLSLTTNGDFPSSGNYNRAFTFGTTQLAGDYRIGVGLASVDGQILFTSTNVPMTVIDTRVFHFGGCGNTGVETALLSSSSIAVSTTSAAPSGFITSFAAGPTVSSSAVQVTGISSASSSSAPPAGTLSSSSSAAIQPAHKSTSPGAIAGGVIGGLVLILIAGILARWYSSRRRTQSIKGAAHRMDHLHSPSPDEKDFGTSINEGPQFPEEQHRRLPEGYYPSHDADAASVFGAPSMGSQFHGYAIPSYPQSEAHSYHNAYDYPSVQGGEGDGIHVVHMPFSLNPGQAAASHSHSQSNRNHDENPFAESTLPYLPSSAEARSRDNFFDTPTGASEVSHTTHKRAPPAFLDTTFDDTTPRAVAAPTMPKSATGSTSEHERKPSSFKIPRVNVPAYLATQQLEDGSTQPVSRASSTRRRRSTDATTFASVDENPFEDAESGPELPKHIEHAREEQGALTDTQNDISAALQYAEALLDQAEQHPTSQHPA